jgi:hypothetical protein
MDQVELVGNLKYHQVAIHIPDAALKSPTLKFRLRSGFHFWEVDQVALGTLDAEPLNYQVQQPTIPNTYDNTSLRHNDETYVELEPKSEPLMVTFDGLTTTGERTLFLRSKGYYRPLSTFEGKRDLSTLNFIRKKGLSTFSKDKFMSFQKIQQSLSLNSKEGK